MEDLVQQGINRVEAISDAMPKWLSLMLILAVSVLVALILHTLLMRLFRRFASRQDDFWRKLVERSSNLMRMGLVLLALAAGWVAP